MAVNQTSVTIVGRLVSEPDHKRTLNDVDVTNFRLASNERRYDKVSQGWVKGDTLFLDVTCWRRLAYNVRACLHKGDPVIVTGRLYTDEYEIDGKRRSIVRMEAWSVGPDLGYVTAVVPPRKDKTEAGSDKPAAVEGLGDGPVDGAVDVAVAGLGPLPIGADFRPDVELDIERKEVLVPVG
jgi:single-strand DNA-binding protein